MHGILNLRSGVEFQVHQHLVVAGTSRVDFLSDISKSAREHKLDLRMDVLHILLHVKLSLAGG